MRTPDATVDSIIGAGARCNIAVVLPARHRLACAAGVLALLLPGNTTTDGQERTAAAIQAPVPGSTAARSPRNANYTIDVSLDHAARALTGSEVIRWRNISSRSTSELQFHLYWNAWRDRESTWLRERRLAGGSIPGGDDVWGNVEVTAITLVAGDGTMRDVTQQLRYIAPDDGNARDRTVMTIPVPEIPPEGTATVRIDWMSRVPRPFARTGTIADYYFVAHWFPKIGVLEDEGWNTHQFHSATEFYADFGTYDVDIRVPSGWVVGASGLEQSRRDHGDGTTTHSYRGEDIHDFTWTTSPHFVEARRTFTHATLPSVEMRLLLQPEHRGQEDRHFVATAAALKYYGEWFGAYPYPNITIIDPAFQSGSGGMEYPTLFTAGTRWLAPAQVAAPEAVTIHEAGHQFWYGMVANNEFEDAWLDEGLNTFSTARVIEAVAAERDALPAYRDNNLVARFFGGTIPWVHEVRLRRDTDGNRLPTYRLQAEADIPSTPTFRYWPASASAMSYDKTALWLHTLERHIGWPTLQKILATYFERWRFRHPSPQDFFAVANEVSGQDLSWFFDQVYDSSNVFDYGVQELSTEAGRSSVVIRRFGEAVFPVEVVTTFANGEKKTERWDGRARRVTYVYEQAERAVRVDVDPGRVLLLDVDRTNNSRVTQPRSAEAARTWSLTWMVWLQDLMLTYGFFV
jgi:hypothetical protein